MTSSRTPRILLVDDESRLLDALRRNLRSRFSVETAVGGAEGLQRLTDAGPFTVVVSDYRMPGMNGAEFLAEARRIAPDSVRMMLTGQADLHGAADTVNAGGIFRMLLKPIPPDALVEALDAAVEHHRLRRVEEELLDETLRGSVKALSEAMSLANPAVFAQGERIGRLAALLAADAGVDDAWPVEVAARLSQLGAITLPPDVLHRHQEGGELDPSEIEMVKRVPEFAVAVIGSIPRLDPVIEAIRDARLPAALGDPDRPGRGARILRIVSDFDHLESSGLAGAAAIEAMASRSVLYDRDLFETFRTLIRRRTERRVVEIPIEELEPGMTLADDILNAAGVKLVPKGQDLTGALLQRVRNFATGPVGITAAVRVYEDRETLDVRSA